VQGACYWKNDSLTVLPGGIINWIAFSGQDVYVFGDGTSSGGHRIIWQWMNGQLTNLSPDSNTTFFGDAKIVNGSVYVTGYGFSSSPTYLIAKLWVNGQETDLSDGSRNVSTTGIFISGSDVYIYAVMKRMHPAATMLRCIGKMGSRLSFRIVPG
jgi:hypothetical protein